MLPDQGKFAHSSAQARRSDFIAELRWKHRVNTASCLNDDGGLLLKPPSQLRYYLIEPLRGIAAVWVFVFHFSFSHEFQIAFPACLPCIAEGRAPRSDVLRDFGILSGCGTQPRHRPWPVIP